MELSDRLKERRLALGLTQQQVAKKIGVDTTTYAHYESGRRTPDINRLRMLCVLFEISVEDHFPIVRTLEYPPELLRTLSETKERVAKELAVLEATCDSISPHDLLWRTRDLMDQLKIAIDPVQEIRTKTMDAPEMDLSGLSNGQTIMRVNYRPEDWLLLSESIQLQSKAINFIFEKQQVSPN